MILWFKSVFTMTIKVNCVINLAGSANKRRIIAFPDEEKEAALSVPEQQVEPISAPNKDAD